MTPALTTLTSDQLHGFERDGFTRVPGAFTADEAVAMRDVVWAALAGRGIDRDAPETWRSEFPDHLQHLKAAPEFRAVGSARTLGAIGDLLGTEHAVAPSDWGAFFLLFPTPRAWTVPHQAWHIDHAWTDPLTPLRELKVHALFGDVAPRAGGMTIVAGSHHVVAHVVAEMHNAADLRAARIRVAVMSSQPYLQALATDDGGDAARRDARIARFVDREEDVLGHPLRVVELTGAAGDIVLIHPLVLHARPTNAGTTPRFLLNKDLYCAREESSDA